MCGICGWIDFRVRPEAACIARMTRTLQHRGPDDCGTFQDEVAGLGHTRLSIVDLTAAGHQPMVHQSGKVVLIFNGEIYNYRTLGDELVSQGIRFGGHSDTEVLLHALVRWGTEALPKLDGMFALGLWSPLEQEFVMARDRFGIKPLYYSLSDNRLVFASEIKALLASGTIRTRIDPEALHEYLYYGSALGERTLFGDVRKVPPGHFCRFSAEGFETVQFASPVSAKAREIEFDEAVRELRTHLESAVQRHLTGDVPVGAFLSGGIDSSCVAAFAARHVSGTLRTFSAGFDFQAGRDERAQARRVAKRFGCSHQELFIRGSALPETIEDLVGIHDEPFGDPANLPLLLLCRELKGAIKVVLQGDGGDEIFAGYRRYALLKWAPLWQRLPVAATRSFAWLAAKPLGFRALRLARALLEPDPALRMAFLLTPETPFSSPLRVLSESWRRALTQTDPFAEYRHWNRELKDLEPVQRLLFTDTKIVLPNDFLEKVDKASMSQGVEVRVPLLDNHLAEFAMSLPSHFKVSGWKKKWVMRQALRDILDSWVLDAPKTGFSVPIGNWLRRPLLPFLQEVLFDPGIRSRNLFDEAVLEETIEAHQSGQREAGPLLWKVLNLALWMQRYSASS